MWRPVEWRGPPGIHPDGTSRRRTPDEDRAGHKQQGQGIAGGGQAHVPGPSSAWSPGGCRPTSPCSATPGTMATRWPHRGPGPRPPRPSSGTDRRPLGHHPFHDEGQAARHVGAQLGQRHRLHCLVGLQLLRQRRAGEGHATRDQVIERASQAVNVTSWIGLVCIAELLRGGIVGRAHPLTLHASVSHRRSGPAGSGRDPGRAA